MYANVLVDIEGAGAPGPLTYSVPEEMRPALAIGSYVRVPLGTRPVLGYVVALDTEPPAVETKPILACIHPEPVFDAPLLGLATWMAHRYYASLAETVRCIVPEGLATRQRTLVSLQNVPDPEAAASILERRSPGLASLIRILAGHSALDVHDLRARWEGKDVTAALGRLRSRGWIREQVVLDNPPARPRVVRAFTPAAPPETLAEQAQRREKRAPAQALALGLFAGRGDAPLLAPEAAALGASAAVLRALVAEGLLHEERVEVRRDPWRSGGRAAPPPLLMPAQAQAVAAIEEALASGQHDTILLHGITASGKTEVYLHAIAGVLAHGRDAIVLLPEISLTAQVVDIFKGRFGDRVAVLHSKLSAGERYDEWRRLRSGEARVAVGPRSALFAPCRPGLIICDEEHEPSYKQENSPRYHARYAAQQRARIADALLILGSATPSVESYYLAQSGEYRILEMPERVPGRVLPTVHVADLCGAEARGASPIFSQALLDGLASRLERREQAILFLNRRGFASFVLCRDCGHTPQCPNCSVSLTLHTQDHSLRCHHCNHRRAAPTLCPQCQGDRIRPFGLGTERVEEEVRAHFPDARVLRMDRDTTAGKDAHTRLYRAFRDGEADILVGTQMVAKGLDFPNVTLVGVVAADLGLNVPDFRAAERTFHLLVQVAGRAGRGERPGEVVIQTFNPDHYAVRAASNQDYAAFYAQEVDFRRELRYPPFGVLVSILSSDTDADAAEARATRTVAAIAAAAKRGPGGIEVLGPAPAPLARVKRRYRWRVLVRGTDDREVQAAVRAGLGALTTADLDGLVVDVDPCGMM